MNNRDWLYTLQPRGLARWFEAEHVEPNDDFEPKDGVSEGKADANDAKKVSTTSLNVPNVIKWQYMDGSEHVQEFAQDSREKLEADVRKRYTHTVSTAMWPPSANKHTDMVSVSMDDVLGWLDRQASIAERECLERATGELVGWDCAECAEGFGRELDARCDPLKARIDELTTKVDELTAEREQLTNAINELQKKQPYCYNPEQPLDTLNTIGQYIDELTAERDELAEKLAESGELVNGGNAEDWYRCLEDMTRGKELIEKSLIAENKRLRNELEQAKSGLKHQKEMRKRAESLVKDGQALDMAELKAERDMWRDKCGQMLDAAHEIERIAEVDE